MLSQPHRLRARRDIDRVFKQGMVFHTSQLTVRALFSRGAQSRGTVVVSNKTAKKAVDRNRIKRKLRPILREVFAQTKRPVDIILIAKTLANKSDFQQLHVSVFFACKKMDIL
ncbi:MAG TPA: ribonuclease P protein component [Patescibacteria group bacterium]|nr:ribonuclease P protein component [Patescibacteria group bacterium]